MTRTKKLHKLANAVREYRGRRHGTDGAWIDAPKLAKQSDVARWLTRLGVGVTDGFKAIDNFKSFAEMRAWMTKLESAGVNQQINP